MATAIKLKETLSTNVPVVLRIKKRGGEYPETNYTTKEPTGRSIFLYFFENDKGEELKHYASEKDQEVLSLFQAGESVQVVLKDTLTKEKKRITYLSFTPVDGAEAQAAATPQLKSNTAETRGDRKQEAWQSEDKIKQIMISLAGLTQSHICAGKTNEEALALAVEARKMIIEKAIDLSSADPS